MPRVANVSDEYVDVPLKGAPDTYPSGTKTLVWFAPIRSPDPLEGKAKLPGPKGLEVTLL